MIRSIVGGTDRPTGDCCLMPCPFTSVATIAPIGAAAAPQQKNSLRANSKASLSLSLSLLFGGGRKETRKEGGSAVGSHSQQPETNFSPQQRTKAGQSVKTGGSQSVSCCLASLLRSFFSCSCAITQSAFPSLFPSSSGCGLHISPENGGREASTCIPPSWEEAECEV